MTRCNWRRKILMWRRGSCMRIEADTRRAKISTSLKRAIVGSNSTHINSQRRGNMTRIGSARFGAYHMDKLPETGENERAGRVLESDVAKDPKAKGTGVGPACDRKVTRVCAGRVLSHERETYSPCRARDRFGAAAWWDTRQQKGSRP